MADSTWAPNLAAGADAVSPRHSLLVRVTHWVSALCFLGLLVTGIEIVISHPRFYWGETGNSATQPLFQIPIPASRPTVPTGYSYVLPDQNGWSRALHFQAAWLLGFAGLLYLAAGRIGRRLVPSGSELSAAHIAGSIAAHLRPAPPVEDSYNVLQKIAYLKVVFMLVPLMIWTGLAMSPSFTAAFPAVVTSLGGHQSARTIHFFVAISLVLFVLVHLVMVWRSGWVRLTRAMITGNLPSSKDRP